MLQHFSTDCSRFLSLQVVSRQLLGIAMAIACSAAIVVAEDKPATPAGKSRVLFDGKSLEHWKKPDVGEDGTSEVKDGIMVIGKGSPMNGLIWTGPALPKSNYELNLEAQRIAGTDFFTAVTFPVKDSACTLVLGGWGGGLTGLSSLNGIDASENETLGYREFKQGQWYQICIRVTDDRIECWLDGESLVNIETADKEIDVRIEMEVFKPLGLATYRTTGGIRKFELTELAPKK